MLTGIFLAVLGALPLVLIWVIIEGAGPVQIEPMDYDEEIEWLMKDGLSLEEAKEIADLPWRIWR